MNYGKKKEEKKEDNDEEVAIALVAECHIGEKTFKAGETWTDPKHDCRMGICNPGGVISYLECPKFESEEGDEIRIPGDNQYAYPHCCDYVFHTKQKKKEKKDVEEKEKDGGGGEEGEGDDVEEEGGGGEGKGEDSGEGKGEGEVDGELEGKAEEEKESPEPPIPSKVLNKT